MPNVGIIISAKDNAGAVLKKIGTESKSAFDLIHSASAKAGAGFKALGAATVVLNQGLGLAKKVFGTIGETITSTVNAALEFRKIGDPAVKAFKDMKDGIDLVKGRIGDALIPILHGASEALQPVIKSTIKWLDENRKLIGGKLIDWISNVANFLVNGVAKAIILVTRVWTGWHELILFVKMSVEKFFAGIIGGVASALQAYSALQKMMGFSLPDAVQKVIDGVDLLGQTFNDSGDQTINKMNEIADGQRQLEDQVNSYAVKVKEVIENVAVKAHEKLNASVTQSTIKMKDLHLVTLNYNEMLANGFKEQQDLYNKKADFMTKDAAYFDAIAEKEKQQYDELAQVGQQYFNSIASAAGFAFAGMITGSQDMADAMSTAVIGAAQTSINSYAASAAAAAAFSQAGIPIIGPILAATASAVVFGLVKGFLAKTPKAATGGLIFGGSPGVDNVPILAQRGEGILNVRQMRSFERLTNALDRQPNNQSSSLGQSGKTVIQHNNFSSIGPIFSADAQRATRDFKKMLGKV